MKFKLPYLTRLAEIKEKQLKNEYYLLTEFKEMNKNLLEILNEIKKIKKSLKCQKE